ncbi:hypothetical protein CO058_02245 [candidate division WWE3 bacterium CG_4_9_14_0_2_um_filter_35_11]|uniref:Uncharacterized protein n=1 Tax=candidate division WWE3 bacterium CG_4_9_14_0_2_um_filter_35_11 TaxID=1975077 RepID=A0A2M8ELQ2_UNCKA|nr:MAG: hypothetical protein COV25_00475 [candidate division WWE3 bacterium CG10_big_fil_rev_8_21_14_0_10_35_32]PJC23669.1 MAG: hypothetical protein CO058_02245 [candidate division WWE3 bacterium CG_4_9_14_0_2_um_filter_35_11]
MKLFEDAFVLVHIRISSCKIFGVSARLFLTGSAVFFILANAVQMYLSTSAGGISWGSFVEAALFTVITIYATLIWMISWPKANKMLNKAVEYEKSHKHS